MNPKKKEEQNFDISSFYSDYNSIFIIQILEKLVKSVTERHETCNSVSDMCFDCFKNMVERTNELKIDIDSKVFVVISDTRDYQYLMCFSIFYDNHIGSNLYSNINYSSEPFLKWIKSMWNSFSNYESTHNPYIINFNNNTKISSLNLDPNYQFKFLKILWLVYACCFLMLSDEDKKKKISKNILNYLDYQFRIGFDEKTLFLKQFYEKIYSILEKRRYMMLNFWGAIEDFVEKHLKNQN